MIDKAGKAGSGLSRAELSEAIAQGFESMECLAFNGLAKSTDWASSKVSFCWEQMTSEPPLQERLHLLATAVKRHLAVHWRYLAGLELPQATRKMAVQVGCYCFIALSALGLTYLGSNMMLQIISNKMTEMGGEVVKRNLPVDIEMANLRPAIK